MMHWAQHNSTILTQITINNYFSRTTILRNKNYDALIKITPYNLKPPMPICLKELGMIPLRNLACFPWELGPICLK